MALWLDLTEAFLFFGIAVTILAVAFGVAAAVAFAALGNPPRGGVATAGWFICVALSLASSVGFTGDWFLPTLAVSALPVALVLAAAGNLAFSAWPRTPRRAKVPRPVSTRPVFWSSSVVR
jgi:hypothetical protein